MKFLYEYRTSDNVVHDGVIAASSRDDAFAALKQKGIRPARMTEAPGVMNKLFGKGKRWIAIFALSLVVMALAVIAFNREVAEQEPFAVRHQIYGDRAIIDAGILTDWRGVFTNEGDRVLARFAQPGILVGRASITDSVVSNLEVSLKCKVLVRDDDLIEHRQLKLIVAGMKEEMSEYLRDGGTVELYLTRLHERQNVEASIYRRLEAEVMSSRKMAPAELNTLWMLRNSELRSLGIRTISMPKELDGLHQ